MLSSQKHTNHADHQKHLELHSVWAAFAGLMIHTFFDGAAIAARIMVSPVSGILVFAAVLSHKIPEGFSMASIFQIGRFNRAHAFLAATALGASTVTGAVMVFISGQSELSMTFLALATGSFTYIVCSELLPYLSGTKDRKSIVLFILGIGLFFLSQQLLASIGFAEHAH